MNKLRLYFKISIFTLCGILLQGCLKSDDDYPSLSIGTVRFINDNPETLFFQLDSKNDLYPNSLEFPDAKKLKNKDRVFIEFTEVEENKSGYTADILSTHLIHTEQIVLESDKEKLNSYLEESAKINISEIYIINGFITLKYTCFEGDKDLEKHKITLYALDALDETDKTLRLFLTHNKAEKGSHQYSGIITFPIDNLNELTQQANQTSILSNTIYNGVQEHIIKITDIHQ